MTLWILLGIAILALGVLALALWTLGRNFRSIGVETLGKRLVLVTVVLAVVEVALAALYSLLQRLV